MTIHNFTQLNVWQRAMDLVVDVYRITDAYPARERFVLASNTRRTAISIPSNIAEGFNIALGSEGELFTQLELGRRLGFTSDSRLTKYFDDLAEVGKMMRGLVTSLERGVVRR